MEHRDFIKLSKRLLMSASMVTKGNVVADVGCDHAHTDIYLVKENIAPKAIAMDVGEGPLSHASANIRLFGLSDKIETRLSDGLEKLEVGEADTLIIAGMGGTLTKIILERKPEVVKSLKEVILQPQSDPQLVRRLLSDFGFEIVCEDMCIEDGKFYNTMKAVPGRFVLSQNSLKQDDLSLDIIDSNDINQNILYCNALEHNDSNQNALEHNDLNENVLNHNDSNQNVLEHNDYNQRILEQEMFDTFGRYLLEHKNLVLRELLLNLQNKNLRVLEKIEASGGAGSLEKREFFIKEKLMIEKALKYFD